MDGVPGSKLPRAERDRQAEPALKAGKKLLGLTLETRLVEDAATLQGWDLPHEIEAEQVLREMGLEGLIF